VEQNGCAVTSASEAPFGMSQLLSKSDPKDNIDFGREMQRMKNEENVLNIIDWLNNDASLRSRVKRDTRNDTEDRQFQNQRSQSDNHSMNSEVPMTKFVQLLAKQSIYFLHVQCSKSQQ